MVFNVKRQVTFERLAFLSTALRFRVLTPRSPLLQRSTAAVAIWLNLQQQSGGAWDKLLNCSWNIVSHPINEPLGTTTLRFSVFDDSSSFDVLVGSGMSIRLNCIYLFTALTNLCTLPISLETRWIHSLSRLNGLETSSKMGQQGSP